MAESSKQRKKESRQRNEADTATPRWTDGMPLSPAWWAPTFAALLILGLIWMLVYYLSGGQFPIPGIRHWNLAIGMLFMVAGFLMTLRWR